MAEITSPQLTVIPLSPEQRALALGKLPDWTYDAVRKALHRTITCEDFAATIGLMMRVAVLAEKRDHHPEWTNVYNRLDIWLTTHDAGDVSDRDVDLAKAIDLALG